MSLDFFKKKEIEIDEKQVNEILKKFLESYVKNEKSKDKKTLEEWLTDALKKELTEKKNDEIEKIAKELISEVNETVKKINEREEKRKIGIKPADCLGKDILSHIEKENLSLEDTIVQLKETSKELEKQNILTIYETAAIKEPDLVAESFDSFLKTKSINEVDNYINNIKDVIKQGNENIFNKVFNQDGSINQNNNLDGFLFEHDHANTFNINAAVKGNQEYMAEVLEPKLGETYKKNSVDLVIREKSTGKIVRKYQAKSYKDAVATLNSFNKGDYRGQRKLTPSDQKIENTNVVIEYDDIESIPHSKLEEKLKQREVQKGNLEILKRDFSKDVDILKLTKQLGRQIMVSGTTKTLTSGILFSTVKNIVLDEEKEPEEIVIESLKRSGDIALSTVVAGGLKTAVEKKVITGTLGKVLSANNVIGALSASSTNILKTAFDLGSGDITFNEGCGRLGSAVSSYYGSILGSAKGKALGGIATKGIVGVLGATGVLGSALSLGIPIITGVIGSFVGGNVLGAIGNGIGRLGGVVVNGAVGTVKAGFGAVKTVAKGIGSIVGSVAGGIGSIVGSVTGGIVSFFGW